MDARRLFAFSTWRIARVERPFVMINSAGGRTILTFTLRDLARGCPLGRDRIDPKADGRRWDSLCAAVGGLEPTLQGLLELTDAEVDVALDPASDCLTYRAVPELVAIGAAETRRKDCSAGCTV